MIKNLILFLFCCSLSASEIYNVQDSSFPIWSQLTTFEVNSLHNLDAAKRGDEDAFLRLSLLSSGDVRTQSDYLKIRTNLKKFFEVYGDNISSENSVWKKGYLLNQSMHAYFFYNEANDSSLNYSEDQSKLSDVFRTRKYNCISSTLLYIHLAKKLNLDVKAVVLPTHTFVELTLEDGRKVDVETTSAAGFDWEHDRKFYKQAAKNWFSERGLQPSSFEDYKNRDIVSPWQLIPLNMRNQHTNPKNMNLLDRLRLQEMASIITPEKSRTLLSLLYAYNEFFIQKDQLEDKTELMKVYEISYPRVSDLIKMSFESNEELDEAAHWYFSHAAYSFLQAGMVEKANFIFLENYSNFKRLPMKALKLNSNYAFVFNGLLQEYIKNEHYKKAQKLINKIVNSGLDEGSWGDSIVWYYSSRIIPLWEEHNWNEIIAIWNGIQSKDFIFINQDQFKNNIESAYLNQSLSHKKNNNLRAAKEILLRCIEELPLATNCLNKLDEDNKEYSTFH